MNEEQQKTRRAVERELSLLTTKREELETELERLKRLINDLKAMHNVNAVFRRDMEEFYD